MAAAHAKRQAKGINVFMMTETERLIERYGPRWAITALVYMCKWTYSNNIRHYKQVFRGQFSQ